MNITKPFFYLFMPIIAIAMFYLVFIAGTNTEDLKEVPSWQQKFVIKRLTLLADQGDNKAAYQLAQNYDTGNGVPVDKSKAVYWLQKAADLGNVWALSDLGVRYNRGEGVQKNPQKAFELYQRGAEKGDFAAMYNLGLIYSRLDNTKDRPVPINYPLAISWYEKSIKAQPEQCATNDLGFLYAQGNGVEKNQTKANELFHQTIQIMFDNDDVNYDTDRDTISRISEVFAAYQSSLATHENLEKNMQQFDPRMVAHAKETSQKLVERCWK